MGGLQSLIPEIQSRASDETQSYLVIVEHVQHRAPADRALGEEERRRVGRGDPDGLRGLGG